MVKMKMAKEVSLHPELVKDVVDELLEMDIISKKQIKNLKSDNDLKIDDPNVKMDLRHELVKAEQKAARKIMRTHNTMNRRLTSIQDSKVKCMKVIDQEIHKFVKKLKIEHKQILLSQNKSLTSGKEGCRPLINNYVPCTSNIAEQQFRICEFQKSFDLSEFGNIHLTPEPIELKGRRVSSAPTPVCQTVLETKTNRNDCSFLMPERPPNNTPIDFKKLYDSSCLLSICVAKKVQDVSTFNHEKSVAIKVHRKWKKYVMKKKENRIKTEHENKLILKKYFNMWSQYYKKQEIERNTQRQLKQNENEKKIHALINGLLEKQKQVLVSKITPGEDLLRKKTPVQSETTAQCSRLKAKLERFVNKTDNNCGVNGNINTINKEKTSSNRSEIKILDPANIKLKNHTEVIKWNKNVESMQKKISQQNEVIDKQKKQIKHQTQQLEQFQIKLLHMSAKFDEEKATERLKQCKLHTKVTKEGTMKSVIQHKKDEINNDERAKLIIKRMEERAEVCRKRNLLAKERREKKEREKIQREQEFEEQKLKEQQENKKKKIQEKKEWIKMQRLDQLQKYLEAQKEKQLMSLASNHYYKTLLKRALKGFRMIMFETELLNNKCKDLYNKKLLKNYFKLWERNASDLALKKVKMAVNLYNKNLLITCWKHWIRYYEDYVRKCQVSIDWYYMKLQERAFQQWRIFTDLEIINTEEKMQTAQAHYEKYLMKLAFKQWKQLPAVMFLEREREKRIHSWRERVQEMLPDYCPIFPEEFEM